MKIKYGKFAWAIIWRLDHDFVAKSLAIEPDITFGLVLGIWELVLYAQLVLIEF